MSRQEFYLIEKSEWREVKQLIERLPPLSRIAWLIWCCQQVSKPGNEMVVTESTGETWQVFGDWMTLCYHAGMDWRMSRDELLRRVRANGSAQLWRGELCRLLP